MIVSVTTARMPSASTSGARAASTVSRTKVSTTSAYSRATPTAETSRPSEASIRSAGPLSARPPMIGLTAATGTPRLRAASRSSRRPGTARIGATDTSGFEGQTTIADASASAARTSGVGRAASIPANRSSSTSGACRRRTK